MNYFIFFFPLTGVGITFKLVKSNSCSSRLELAGATDIADNNELELEDTEVVRKMVHHFETSTSNNRTTTTMSNANNEVSLTINNQTPVVLQRANENDDDDDGLVVGDNMKHDSGGVQKVTVNNHINVAKGNLNQSALATTNDLIKLKMVEESHEKEKKLKTEVNNFKVNEEKMYQTEAKDIYLDNGSGGGSAGSEGTCVKICRNKNVDLAFTLVSKQHSKSLGISQEIAKNNTTYIGNQNTFANTNNNVSTEEDDIQDKVKKCVTYENILLPTITTKTTAVAATTTLSQGTTIKNSNKMSTGDLKVDEAYKQDNHMATISATPSTTPSSSSSCFTSAATQNKPSQIIVPVEIHRVDNNNTIQQQQNKLSSSSSTVTSNNMNTIMNTTMNNTSPKGVEEKSFLPLSTTSSVTSVIDKTVVKHYVANDKSIYEKRKYDDIEFEEFEIYDPTKDFEKLIEEEKLRHANDYNDDDNICQVDNGQHSSSSTSTSTSTSTTTSMATAKSQQTNNSAETETDCYDSLDDKL